MLRRDVAARKRGRQRAKGLKAHHRRNRGDDVNG